MCVYVFSPCHIKAFYKKQCISCVSCSAVSDSFDPMICNLPARLLCPQWSICCPSKGVYPFLTLMLDSNSFSHLLDPTTSFFSTSWIITKILYNSNLTSFRKPSSATPTKRNHSCLQIRGLKTNYDSEPSPAQITFCKVLLGHCMLFTSEVLNATTTQLHSFNRSSHVIHNA